jgi:hypothetical protein
LHGKAFCFAHDPDLAERRRQANAQGGKNKATVRRLDRLTPITLRPVLQTLHNALIGLEDGSVDPRVGTAMAAVAGAIVKVHEVAELEARLEALEGANAGGIGR